MEAIASRGSLEILEHCEGGEDVKEWGDGGEKLGEGGLQGHNEVAEKPDISGGSRIRTKSGITQHLN